MSHDLTLLERLGLVLAFIAIVISLRKREK